MKTLAWYYPRDLEEATLLLQEPGVVPHGGGTGLLRTGLGHLSGLVDLRYLPVFDFKVQDGVIEMGAGLTFAEVVRRMSALEPDSVLVKSLGRAAATPLRNRITIGGSVAMAPPWSDLLGPLVALEAEVVLAGGREETCPVADYVADRERRTGTLVTAVRVRREPWQSVYVRATATHFDYAAFTITLLAKTNDGVVEDIRLVVVGAKNKVNRLRELEASLIGQPAGALRAPALGADLGLEFPAKTIGGPEYVAHLFHVELERALAALG